MGGCRCSYKTCRNTTKSTENSHFFHYPVKQKERCKAWIQNAEKPQFFELDEYQLRNKVVCEVHFEDKCFLNSQKKRLLPTAIPTLDGNSCSDDDDLKSPSSALTYIRTLPKVEKFKTYSTKLDDIQILPANEEGTSFVVDTYPSYKLSKDVKSFVINDDSVLPLDEPPASNSIKIERQDDEEFILSNHNNSFQNNTKTVTDLTETSGNYILNEASLESMICKTIESKYLEKLDQHSQDLNHIKKALRLSRKANAKLTKASVVRFLKTKLPPSLMTLVSLSIDDDYALTEDDETFFKNLHDQSTKAYQFLMDDCSWRMPIIEIHEEDGESMDEN